MLSCRRWTMDPDRGRFRKMDAAAGILTGATRQPRFADRGAVRTLRIACRRKAGAENAAEPVNVRMPFCGIVRIRGRAFGFFRMFGGMFRTMIRKIVRWTRVSMHVRMSVRVAMGFVMSITQGICRRIVRASNFSFVRVRTMPAVVRMG